MLPSSLPLSRHSIKGVAQIRGKSYHLKSSGLKVCLPTSKIWTRIISFHLKISHKCVLHIYVLVNSRCSQVELRIAIAASKLFSERRVVGDSKQFFSVEVVSVALVGDGVISWYV